MNKVITVENLGKRYTLHHQSERQPYLALRDVLAEGARNFGKRLLGQRDKEMLHEEFWALRNVSFEVDQGARIGIIGRNGAGKSTLLKILSRITEPTTGRVRIKGRVASLLEVGTGFHPELTGRENIFLNGAILGMSRAEIKKKFDEIVDFAEIEKFLDTPVKRYSSGMYVRLAFAVAAHLEPEILIVDEVLAVGDAQFQKKCLGKMEDVSAKQGRTVLFVSHNMAAIADLCTSGVLLGNGRIVVAGPTDEVIRRYLETDEKSIGEVTFELKPEADACIIRAGIFSLAKTSITRVDVREPFIISVVLTVQKAVRDLEVSIRIRTQRGTPVCFASLSDSNDGSLASFKPGTFTCSFEVPAFFLVPDHYRVSLILHEPCIRNLDIRQDDLEFTVDETGSSMKRYGDPWVYGSVLPKFKAVVKTMDSISDQEKGLNSNEL
ncbi:O-antigen export system ATP-binding protein RfbB [Geobacter sp. OR-1]|uniref:ABC transporter ATP-binding protein n=1 Tax=Geobacter sp. OR-1 TaxID=1266765 RepID=UPI000542CD7F|nr:ABC transporter ATP-binding protein [Geobacter sp. OR-1]GAM11528.1 O-antigen export system ATP-binding protein RfbB [Geobacter sp. OR-1]